MALSRSCCGLLVGFLVFTTTLHMQISLQVTPPCQSDQHYEHVGRCCTKCEPGKYMFAKCTSTSETVCQPCGPNEYMDIWNEEEKCLLHKICDHGRALIEMNPGNSTFQRQCACTAGYHWNEDCDCCRRNTKCPPGFGVKYPVQQNKDTLCVPCSRGSFSNVSSATEACKTWTNCTALGTEEKSPGSNRSDAVCKQPLTPRSQDETSMLFYTLIAPLFFVALVGIVVLAVYYHNKGKTLKADLQYWAQEICRQIKGTKESPGDAFVNVNVGCPAGHLFQKGTYLLDLDEYSFSEDMCCPHGHMSGTAGPHATRCGPGEVLSVLPLVSKEDPFRQIPTEDEYAYRTPGSPQHLPLSSQPERKPVSPFSEPVEVGENDSLSQCFTGTESLVELTSCSCPDASCGIDLNHVCSHQCLQDSCHLPACSNARDGEPQDLGASLLMPGEAHNCTACQGPCRESPGKPSNATDSFNDGGPPPLGTCGLDSSCVDQTSSAENTSARNGPCDGNGTKHQNTKRTPESNSSTSGSPAASGNVTGNGNSTFISSGQVMNFKGEVIVVYVSQNSQEGSMSPGSSDESLGRPVQEENLSRCETFAGNTPPHKEKCAEMNSLHSMADHEPPSTVRGFTRTFGPIIQEEHRKGQQDSQHLYNEASQPVQEEGKPGQSLKQALH